MASAVRLRGDYTAAGLRELAKRSVDSGQTRRLLALAAIYDGASRSDGARMGGIGLQTLRDWVLALQRRGTSRSGGWEGAGKAAFAE
jgi:transposase